MKLTILPQNFTFPTFSLSTSSSSSSILPSSFKCCSSSVSSTSSYSESQKHSQHIQQNQPLPLALKNIIKTDCIEYYHRIDPSARWEQIYQMILRVMEIQRVQYGEWIGYLCAHAINIHKNSHGNVSKNKNKSSKGFDMVLRFVEKFRAAFEQQKCKESILAETLKRIQQHCSDQPLYIPTAALTKTIKKYQQSFLLKYTPIEYSAYMISRYLSQDGDIEEYVRLCASLAHFVVSLNPVSEEHALKLMEIPYMGVVEWPIVISNRSLFTAEGGTLKE